jgi:hypothetical protein
MAARPGVAEDDGGQGGTVDGSGLGQNPAAEARDDGGMAGRAGRDGVVREPVGVDRRHACGGKQLQAV